MNSYSKESNLTAIDKFQNNEIKLKKETGGKN